MSEDLWQRLQKRPVWVTVHSCFRQSLNLMCGGDMITLLSRGKCLQPSSVLLDYTAFFDTWRLPEEPMLLSKQGLSWNGELRLPFAQLKIRSVRLQNQSCVALRYADQIKEFLTGKKKGICGLVEDRTDDVYTQFLQPRIQVFRQAVLDGDQERIRTCVQNVAGCGQGLTPSSDDFLCGYMSAFPQNHQNRQLCSTITSAACKKTNDISAALLRYAERGLYSVDILGLFSAFHLGSHIAVELLLKRVAEFGSSSGCDYLTGMYFGILDSNKKEGFNVGKA